MAQEPDKALQTKEWLLEENMQPNEEPTPDNVSLWGEDVEQSVTPNAEQLDQQNVQQAFANAKRIKGRSASITANATAMKRERANSGQKPTRARQAAQNQQHSQEPSPPLSQEQVFFQGQQNQLQMQRSMPMQQPRPMHPIPIQQPMPMHPMPMHPMPMQQAYPIWNLNQVPPALQGQQHTEMQNLAGRLQAPRQPAQYQATAAYQQRMRMQQQGTQQPAQYHAIAAYEQRMRSQQQAGADQITHQQVADVDWFGETLSPNEYLMAEAGQQSAQDQAQGPPGHLQLQNQRSSRYIGVVPPGFPPPPQNQHATQHLAQGPLGFPPPQQRQVAVPRQMPPPPPENTAELLRPLSPPDLAELKDATVRVQLRAQVPRVSLEARIAGSHHRRPMYEIAQEHTHFLEAKASELESALRLTTKALKFEQQQAMLLAFSVDQQAMQEQAAS